MPVSNTSFTSLRSSSPKNSKPGMTKIFISEIIVTTKVEKTGFKKIQNQYW
jgi:hypothetical protein